MRREEGEGFAKTFGMEYSEVSASLTNGIDDFWNKLTLSILEQLDLCDKGV